MTFETVQILLLIGIILVVLLHCGIKLPFVSRKKYESAAKNDGRDKKGRYSGKKVAKKGKKK